MRVSAKAEYACIAVLELAANYQDPQPIHLKSIAAAHGIPQRFLVQILLQLKGAGLVASSRGASGGYHLARPPAGLSLAEVINAIDRTPPSPVAPAPSASPAVDAVRSVWKDLHTEEQRSLEKLTFAELARRVYHANAPSYQI